MNKECKTGIDIMLTLVEEMWGTNVLPCGWVKTFGNPLTEELAEIIGDYIDDFVVFQMKEKYGQLRFYWSWADRDYDVSERIDLENIQEKIEQIIQKYADISSKTCVVCGKETINTAISIYAPICEDCYENMR